MYVHSRVHMCFILYLNGVCILSFLCFLEQLNALHCLHQQHVEDVRKHADEVIILNQTVARLQQELNDTRSSLHKKNEELATITEDLGAKEALLTDTKNKELQVSVYLQYLQKISISAYSRFYERCLKYLISCSTHVS